MLFTCLGCNEGFEERRALAQHKRHCRVLPSEVSAQVAKRKIQEDSAHSARLAKRQRQHEAEEAEAQDAHVEEEELVPPAPVPPNPAHLSRSGRPRKVPRRYQDLLPTTYTGLPVHVLAAHPLPPSRIPTPAPCTPSPPPVLPAPGSSNAAGSPHGQSLPHQHEYRTKPDVFGLYCVYAYKPQRDPHNTSWEAVCDESIPSWTPRTAPLFASPLPGPTALKQTVADQPPPPPYAPFPNISTFDLLFWQYNGSNLKSNEQMNGLTTAMQQPGFDPADLAKFNAAREIQRLDTYIEDTEGSALSARDGWFKRGVKIRVPKEGKCYASEEDCPMFEVESAHLRPFHAIIQNAYQQPCVREWDLVPYKLMWLPPKPVTFSGADAESLSRSTSPFPLAALASPTHTSSTSSTSDTGNSSTSELSQGIRVRREIFDSDAMLDDDAEMRRRPREAGDPDDLEYALAPILLWTDGTHLTNFGSASLWPAYAYFGSQSKYTRGKPTAFAAHHVAYIPSLPDKLQDFYIEIYGVPATSEILTFLKRELMQEVWLLLLDDRFMFIYVHGLVLLCGDELRRRLFPRLNIHSADYPEKILQACLKYFAKCPCPRCKINKDKIIEMGTRNDLYRRNHVRVDNDDLQYRIKLTRRWIFEEGISLKSVYIKRVLDPLSLTPTRSAFSTRLREYGFNFYSLYVPDLMHEIELGVWKAIFSHILRILYAAGNDAIQELNRRFRQIPTFGRIRRFSDNVADQRKLAARDYENNLRTSLPPLEALLQEEDNKIISDMVFDLNYWHCLAKLRAITNPQIFDLELHAIEVGKDVRKFSNVTCNKYVTIDLPKEAAARGRRKAALSKKTGKVSVGKQVEPRRRRVFNMNTYKFHALRDYPASIRHHATTDNWSTQTGELEHRHVKRFYARTNKHKHELQIAQHTRRSEKLRIIKARVDAHRQQLAAQRGALAAAFGAQDSPPPSHTQETEPTAQDSSEDTVNNNPDDIAYASPWDRYHIAESQRESDDITTWVSEHASDPAFRGFLPRLRSHLRERVQGHSEDDPNAPPPPLYIAGNRIYHHRVFRVNYTTYDVRRAQDSINPRTHPDMMLLAPLEDSDSADGSNKQCEHPFLYARVIGVFHVNVHPIGSPAVSFERIDVLWVRWWALDRSAPGGVKTKRLHRVEFIQDTSGGTDSPAFGFVDPHDVIRGAHLIPAFAHKRTSDLLGPSPAARVGPEYSDLPAEEVNTDFRYYYVNMFADRDIFLRYHGGGVGHTILGGHDARATFGDDASDTSVRADLEGEDVDAMDVDDVLGTAEVSSEADLLRLVPELARGRPSGIPTLERVEEAQGSDEDINGDDDDDEVERVKDANGEDEEDEEDEEVEEDEEDLDSGPGMRLGDDFAGDEYDGEGFAPL